jgi:hypothetical protein
LAEKKIIDTFFRDLKGRVDARYSTANLYAKLKVVGFGFLQNYSAISINVVAPASTKFTIFNSPTLNTDNIDFDGSTQYINTNYNFSNFTKNNTHFLWYSSENVNSSGPQFGLGELNGIYIRWTDGVSYNYHYTSGLPAVNFSLSDSRGSHLTNRLNATSHRVLHDGSLRGSNTNDVTSQTMPYGQLILSHLPIVSAYGSMNLKLFTAGDGLTTSEEAALHNTIQTFLQRLGIANGTIINL